MDQARHQPLEQLALRQDDLGLVADALRDVAGPVGWLAHPHEPDQQPGPAREERAADRECGRQGQRSGGDGYDARAFFSSAVIAGTISVRSPITA